ncbi:MAG: kelch repeat-containing protein, partial [Pseudomonadota bacterium]
MAAEEILTVKDIPNHNDDGSLAPGVTSRESTGIAVAGSETNPVIYVASSDIRVGGPSGDKDLDTNSGVITRITWNGTQWETVDIVRGLPRSEENHATNGLEFVNVGGVDYLIVASGGHTNAGAPSTNFAWHTEYALSAAVLAVNLTQLEALPVLNDGRDYIYDLPTVDDPTRPNENGVSDPSDPAYDGVDVGDPFGGNDGLNQAKIVIGGPVQIFSPGYRNTYDLVVTESGAVYVTDNGANGGWGGYPENEGLSGTVTNNFRPGEPGSTSADPIHGDPAVNNVDSLSLVTNDIQTYVFGSFYGGHPTPIRANPLGAGLFARGDHSSDPTDLNGNGFTDDWFRTTPFDPAGSGDASDPQRALPADWPPVPISLANPIEGDFRNPGGVNPDGPDDEVVTTWLTNTNGIDEYTASNFEGALQGDLIAGRSGGNLHRVQVNPADGSLVALDQNFASNLGGNPLGIATVGDDGPFPGTIWVATFNSNIVVLSPDDAITCVLPGEPSYDPLADNDFDGYTNGDEEANGSDACNGGSQPSDFDKIAGAPLVSDLNDPDDDADGTDDALDPLQLGDPESDDDAFALPVVNDLFSGNQELKGYLGLGFTGLMNNGAPNPNWLEWLDDTDAGPNPNDILGGAVGAMTMQMNAGTALGTSNTQEKGFQYGVVTDVNDGGLVIEGRLLNLNDGVQLYPFSGDGELGIFMGDGTQSNFVQITVDDAGVEVLQEVADTPVVELSQSIPLGNRPTSSITLRFDVDSASGEVAAAYALDQADLVSMGTFFVQGAVLQAIQQANQVLTVGLIGTSNTPGAEVEGTWDYLNVVGKAPVIQAVMPDVERNFDSPSEESINLNNFFDDDDGDQGLIYSVQENLDPTISASVSGNFLDLVYPPFDAVTSLTIRATDANGFFVEQTFAVSIANTVPIFRVNTGGLAVDAIDGGVNWEEDTPANSSQYLVSSGSNVASSFQINGFSAEVDLSATPTSIFASERWDRSGGGNIVYSFPVTPGDTYEVRVFAGNGWSGTALPGQRVFDVLIEGQAFSDFREIDLSALFGHQVGGVLSTTLTAQDNSLDIEFVHGLAQNPLVNGIEIIAGAAPQTETPIQLQPVSDQQSIEQGSVNLALGASGGDTGGLLFEATGLPPGLQIEPTTGLVFGTVGAGSTQGSPYQVTVTVDDTDAVTDDQVSVTFVWSVSASGWSEKDESLNYSARSETSFVQAGNKFFLFGGRQAADILDTYDFATNSWSQSAQAPFPVNHYQAVEYEGLIWLVGGFQTNVFPSELPTEHVWIYDPANDVWSQGPEIPAERRRGGAGVAVFNGRIYIVGGNTLGHDGGFVPWFDEFDPQTGVWTPLPDAPHARDHFHAVVSGNALYAAGGRLSGGAGGTFEPRVAEVDVFDFNSGTWSTLPSGSDLPTPRAGTSAALFDDKVVVMGGEGGGQAFSTVEALDPTTGTWTTLPSMNFARHGTQAIVSGEGIYITAGSPQQGGGSQQNMEVFGVDQPSGIESTPGSIAIPSSVVVSSAAASPVQLDHVGGNQGIYVTSITIVGANAPDFQLQGFGDVPFLIPVNESVAIPVVFSGSVSNASASLQIVYDGGKLSVVDLVGNPSSSGSITVTPVADQTSVEGSVISLQVSATGGDTGTLSYAALGLPSGLSINP